MIDKRLLDKLMPITEEEKRFLSGEKAIDRDIYMNSPGNVISNRKLLSGGKQITVRPHTRFVHFPLHSHDYVEIVYMCCGSTTHIIDGDEIVLREGELLFLCQRAKQEVLPALEGDIAVNFIVMPSFFDQTLKMIGEEETPLRSFLVDCLKNGGRGASYLHFKVSDLLPVQNLLENLIWTLLHETTNKRSINQTSMGLVFLHLMGSTEHLAYSSESSKITVNALRYIEENYKNGSLTQLSESMHYDISTVSREIKSKTGKTYTEHLQTKRLSQACFLLRNTDMTVEEAAASVGYENLSFFYRLFRKTYGISPKKYKSAKK